MLPEEGPRREAGESSSSGELTGELRMLMLLWEADIAFWLTQAARGAAPNGRGKGAKTG
jgi:hypothetical protein